MGLYWGEGDMVEEWPSLDPSESFAALWMKRRRDIRTEACLRIFTGLETQSGQQVVEALHSGNKVYFVQFYVLENLETEPRLLGEISREINAYIVASSSVRVEAKHYGEITIRGAPGVVQFAVKKTHVFDLPAAPPEELIATRVGSMIRSLLAPKETKPAPRDIRLREKHPHAPRIYIDGANIARMATFWNGNKNTGRNGRVEALRATKNSLFRLGYYPIIIYDPSLRTDPTIDLNALDQDVAPAPPHMRAEPNMEADVFLLSAASNYDSAQGLDGKYIITMDKFEDHRTKFPDFDFESRLVCVRWALDQPTFYIPSRNWHHKHNTAARAPEMLPRAGPALS